MVVRHGTAESSQGRTGGRKRVGGRCPVSMMSRQFTGVARLSGGTGGTGARDISSGPVGASSCSP